MGVEQGVAFFDQVRLDGRHTNGVLGESRRDEKEAQGERKEAQVHDFKV